MAGPGGDRGQAIQVGAILLFTILVIALAVQQAYLVPNQDRQVEFDHFTGVQNDMEHLRNTVMTAGQQGLTLPAGVTLGTRYPPRLLTVQPPGASGSLRTHTIGGAGDVIRLEHTSANVSKICGLGTLTTRTVTYTPQYNYLHSVANVTYENTVAYTTGRSGGRYVQTGQAIVSGTTIHLYPLVGPYNQSGSGTASMTLYGGVTGKNDSVRGPFSLLLPTRLSAGTWRNLTSGQSTVQSVPGSEAVNITFSGGKNYTLKCSPVGAGSPPGNTSTAGAKTNDVSPSFGSHVTLRHRRGPDPVRRSDRLGVDERTWYG